MALLDLTCEDAAGEEDDDDDEDAPFVDAPLLPVLEEMFGCEVEAEAPPFFANWSPNRCMASAT